MSIFSWNFSVQDSDSIWKPCALACSQASQFYTVIPQHMANVSLLPVTAAAAAWHGGVSAEPKMSCLAVAEDSHHRPRKSFNSNIFLV